MSTKNRFSVYKMENNTYLGDCLCVIYQATPKEMEDNGLTNSDIAIYIKTPKDIKSINSIEDFQKNELFNRDKDVIIRISSECQFGVFGDSHCDCESQRTACLDAIKSYGQGVYVQLPHEGQGRGLFYKAQELQLQIHGFNPVGKFIGKKDIFEASKEITGSVNVDIRSFDILKNIFSSLLFNKYKYILISSNPKKVDALSKKTGITISGSRDVQREINIDNVGEYLAKIYKKRFALSDDDLRDIYEVLFKAKVIPGRVGSLLRGIREDLELGRKFAINHAFLKKIVDLNKKKTNDSPVGILSLSNKKSYREYQVELLVDEKDIGLLINNNLLGSFSDLSFEQNYFYDLVYFKDTVTRDLKIRRKSKINGSHELIESRLVYKAPVGQNEYDIRDITITDRDVADLLSNSLEGYEVYYVPVFTHTCARTSKYPELLTLVKRYSTNFRTLSVMGEKNQVEAFLKDISKQIEVEITPDPTNIRTINKDLSLKFDYEILAREELVLFKEFFKG